MVQELVVAITAACTASVVYVAAGAKIVKQYERGVVFRLGRLAGEVRSPGFTMVVPFVDRLRKVNMQIVTLPVPAQEPFPAIHAKRAKLEDFQRCCRHNRNP